MLNCWNSGSWLFLIRFIGQSPSSHPFNQGISTNYVFKPKFNVIRYSMSQFIACDWTQLCLSLLSSFVLVSDSEWPLFWNSSLGASRSSGTAISPCHSCAWLTFLFLFIIWQFSISIRPIRLPPSFCLQLPASSWFERWYQESSYLTKGFYFWVLGRNLCFHFELVSLAYPFLIT